jgi:hypothetical protein
VPNFAQAGPLFTELPRGLAFSETRIQLCESLCVRGEAKRLYPLRWAWWATQYVAGLDRYSRVGKGRAGLTILASRNEEEG